LSAVYAKEKLNCNIISFGERVTGQKTAFSMFESFYQAKFELEQN